MTKLAVKQTDPETPTEIMADAIVTISAGVKKLRTGRLNDDALILLIQNACGGRGRISRQDIKLVLSSIEQLSALYIRKGRP